MRSKLEQNGVCSQHGDIVGALMGCRTNLVWISGVFITWGMGTMTRTANFGKGTWWPSRVLHATLFFKAIWSPHHEPTGVQQRGSNNLELGLSLHQRGFLWSHACFLLFPYTLAHKKLSMILGYWASDVSPLNPLRIDHEILGFELDGRCGFVWICLAWTCSTRPSSLVII